MKTLTEQLSISMELGCSDECNEFAGSIYQQLSRGHYDRMSVALLPQSTDAWREEHRTARKRADGCARRGYKFVRVRRHERAEEIFVVNRSLDVRQGRAMSDGYMRPPSATPDPTYACPRHGVHPYGVENESGQLVAYLWIYRAGELALVSQILGHGSYLSSGVMYLLWQGMLDRELREPGYVIYNRHDSGTDGLRFYKDRVGLKETNVWWAA